MEVPTDSAGNNDKTLDERSQVLQKQKMASAFLRGLIEVGEKTGQIQFPEETTWKVQMQEREEDLSHPGLELDTALTAYRLGILIKKYGCVTLPRKTKPGHWTVT